MLLLSTFVVGLKLDLTVESSVGSSLGKYVGISVGKLVGPLYPIGHAMDSDSSQTTLHTP